MHPRFRRSKILRKHLLNPQTPESRANQTLGSGTHHRHRHPRFGQRLQETPGTGLELHLLEIAGIDRIFDTVHDLANRYVQPEALVYQVRRLGQSHLKKLRAQILINLYPQGRQVFSGCLPPQRHGVEQRPVTIENRAFNHALRIPSQLPSRRASFPACTTKP